MLSTQRGSLSVDALTTLSGGKLAADLKSVDLSFDDRCIVRDLSMKIVRGDRIGIIGPNGSGKTTLLKLITGEISPDSGEIKLGPSIHPSVIDQGRARLDPDRSLVDTLTGGHGDNIQIGGQSRHVMGYLKDFLFRPEQARTPVNALSGGERGRLALALALLTPTNFLILDEPTNDLDLDTLEVLLEWIDQYTGTVLLVSHDRDFLDRVVTSTLVAESDGQWTEYAGGYSDMLSQQPDIETPSSPGSGDTRRKSASGRATPRPKKLSYNDQRTLNALPDLIDTLQKTIKRLSEELAGPDLFHKKPERFQSVSQQLADCQTQLEKAEADWMTLEMRKESLENGEVP